MLLARPAQKDDVFVPHHVCVCVLRRKSTEGGGEVLYAPLDAAGLARAATELDTLREEAANA